MVYFIIFFVLFYLFFPHRVQATPAAHVRWLKDDLPLNLDPARMIVLPSGALELEQVQLSDQVIN
jgi:neogenin